MFEEEFVKRAAARLSAMAHPLRLQIVDTLQQRKRCSVTELVEHLGVSQPIVSQNLKKLRDAEIVCANRSANSVIYQIAGNEIVDLLFCLRRQAEKRKKKK